MPTKERVVREKGRKYRGAKSSQQPSKEHFKKENEVSATRTLESLRKARAENRSFELVNTETTVPV